MNLTLNVHAASNSYPIYIAEHLPDLTAYCKKQVLIVSNESISTLYLPKVMEQLQDKQVQICLLPDGENHKNQDSINKIYDVLMGHHFARDCTIIALGGGVIGDMTGFAAASFMRGVDFIQIPTTLLSQVDSSVGGKTGINHPLGKNMIGAFWQPKLVCIDTTTLQTLPKREFAAGMAEVIKYALIMDSAFLDWIIEHKDAIIQKNPEVLATMIYKSCAYKADIVGQDEKEGGVRALLNFGHTFAHAIETHMGYGVWLHGEAVAAGMVQAAMMSHLQGLIDKSSVDKIINVLQMFDLPTVAPKIPFEVAMDLMGHDKKVKEGNIRLILLNAIGRAFISKDFEPKNLEQVWGDMQ